MKEMAVFLLLFIYGNSGIYTVEVTEYGHAIITQEIVFTVPQSTDSFSYYIPFPINYLEVYSSTVVVGEFMVMGMQTEITLTGQFNAGEEIYCLCEYLSGELISKEGTEWQLYLPSMEESVTVIMPRGTEIIYLVTESDFPSISEEQGMIHLYWEKIPHAISMYYEVPFTQTSSIPWYALLGVLLSGTGLGLLWIRKRRTRKRLNASVLSVLNDRERCIIEYLYAQGSSRQAQISRACGIPKTSLSKILMKMEERGIIQRTRDGSRTYCSLEDAVLV
jgi:LPXTG-motif cell wall-anchored protein